jgi:glycerol-3-phosphate acyltransferase PlsX
VTRVALDLLGGDTAPDSVVDGALLVLDETDDVALVLVGPPDVAARLLERRRYDPSRLSVAPASQVVGMDEDPARAVRSKRDATVRVAARLVRDGDADAMVSVGSTGAALAAAVFTLTRQRGVSRPPLAALIPAPGGPVVFLDAGATVEASPELLASFALVGAAYARVRLGLERPRVGLLTVGEEAGKGDALRKAAHGALAALPIDFVGNVEGRDVPQGGRADVVVTDGFTGNVLAKGLEAAAATVTGVVRAHLAAAGVPDDLLDRVSGATLHMSPERLGGAVLLGVRGVVVVGHGASTARGVASCVAVAVQAAREGLVPRTAQALAELVELRAGAAS